MTCNKTGKERTRQLRLFVRLRNGAGHLTRQQYRTIHGWIRAGQLETAESAMRKAGVAV